MPPTDPMEPTVPGHKASSRLASLRLAAGPPPTSLEDARHRIAALTLRIAELEIASGEAVPGKETPRIRELARLYSGLSHVNQTIIHADSPQALLDGVCRALVEHGDFAMAWIGAQDPETHLVRALASFGDSGEYLRKVRIYGDDRPEGRGPTGTAIREGRSRIINNFLSDPSTVPWHAHGAESGWRASCAVPVTLPEGIDGALTVYSRETDAFGLRELELLEEAASDLAFGLEAIHAEAERKRSEARLKVLEERQSAILDNIPDIAWLKDAESRYIAVNEAFAVWVGLPRESIAGKTDLEMMPPDLAEKYRSDDRAVLASGKRSEVEELLGDPRGGRIWISTIKTPVFDAEGTAIGTVGISRDVTQRRLAEEALRQSEHFLRDTLDSLTAQICVLDGSGIILRVNKAWERFAQENGGHPERTATGANYLDVCDVATGPDAAQAARMADGIRAVLRGHLPGFELEYPCPSTLERRWFHARVSRFLEATEARLIISHENITGRKLAEDRLRESEAALREAQRIARIGSWEWDAATDVSTWSDELYRIFGRDPSEPATSLRDHAELYTPESFERLSQAVQITMENGGPYDLDLELLRPDGTTGWIAVRGEAVRDASGATVGLRGTAHDITAGKLAEQALRKSQQRYMETLDALNDGLWEWYIPTGTAFFAPAYYAILGCRDGQFPATYDGWRARVHPDDLARAEREIKNSRDRGEGLAVEFRMRHESLGWRWYRTRGKTLELDSAGHALRMAGTLSDITAEREAGEQLRLASAAINAAANAIAVVDYRGVIRWVNPAWVALTGYTAEESIGKPTTLLSSGAQDEAFYRNLWDTVLGGRVWHDELVNKRKDGTLYNEEMTITPLFDPEGRVTDFIAIKQDITDRKLAEARLYHSAFHDSLTGLANRALLTEQIAIAFKRFQRTPSAMFALILADLDRFKNVNDSLGHPVGDQLLIETAKRFQAQVRNTDTVARLGGDEFAILLTDIGGERSPTLFARRLLNAMKEPFNLGGAMVDIGTSLGIVVATPEYASPAQIIRDADIALYRAKESGRGGYEVFDRDMHRRVVERMEIETQLNHAVERGELLLALQPILSLATNSVSSYEALLRWRHPSRGLVPPSVFVPIAEETGLIHSIGDWVVREACRIIRHWPDCAPPPLTFLGHTVPTSPLPVITINISGRQLALDGFEAHLERILAEENVGSESIKIEVTESVMLENPETSRQQLERLVGKGFKLLLDDFGTGYSSLSYLQELPFSAVKLDHAFTARLTPGNRAHELMRGIITLAHNLQLEVIAEGVETPEHLALLRDAGCDHVQGYLLSRPILCERPPT